MSDKRRETIQNFYIGVCKGSGFQLESTRAAALTAKAIGCSPLEVWTAVGSLFLMDEIASGRHPITRRTNSNSLPTAPEAATNPPNESRKASAGQPAGEDRTPPSSPAGTNSEAQP